MGKPEAGGALHAQGEPEAPRRGMHRIVGRQKTNESGPLSAAVPAGGPKKAESLYKSIPETGDGAQGRNRTTDTVIFSHVLYQLSYLGIHGPRTRETRLIEKIARPVQRM
jgi:hypothetical protein